jgi:hypothetical protein
MFGGLILFFRLAPRYRVGFRRVWGPALVTTVLLYAAQSLFDFFFTNFASLNEVYLMEARLKGRKPIAVTHEAPTIDQAMDGAVSKLAKIIENTLSRLKEMKN